MKKLKQIKKMEIHGVKNIKKEVITFGKVNQLVGKNRQGKTTVLQSAELLLEGSTDPSIINVDLKEAKVIGHWEDGLMVTRKIKRVDGGKAKQTVKIEKDGMMPAQPQAYLNKMLGIGTFNPRAMLEPKTRNKTIMEMIDATITADHLTEALKGIDLALPELDYDENALTVIDKAEKHYFANRTERNRDTKAALSRWTDAADRLPPKPALQDDRETSELEKADGELQAGMEGLENKETVYQQKVASVTEMKETVRKAENAMVEIENNAGQEMFKIRNEISELQAKQTRKQTEWKAKAEEIKKNAETQFGLLKSLEKTLGEKPNIVAEAQSITEKRNELSAEIARRSEIKLIEQQEANVDSLKQAHDEAKAKSDSLGEAIAILRGPFKEQVMDSVDLPINGLTYENGEFMVNGISMDQLSSSEAVLIGLVLTQKANPDTNIICIDGAECLDEETYAKLQAKIADDDFSYLITKVGQPFTSATDKIIEMNNGQVQQ